jgi:hypothetical protein
MRHASVELLEAMKGVTPYVVGYGWEAASAEQREREQGWMCMADDLAGRSVAACWGVDNEEPPAVDCPACLVVMCLATDPMRWDTLLERGLVQPLVGMER